VGLFLLCLFVLSVKITQVCRKKKSPKSMSRSCCTVTCCTKKKKFHLFQANFSSTNIAQHLSSMKLVHRHRRVILRRDSIFIFTLKEIDGGSKKLNNLN
jgi:hypothetical protein